LNRTGQSFRTGVWHHLAVTLSGSNACVLYVGRRAGEHESQHDRSKPSSLGSTTQNYIGKSQWPDPNLTGSVDEHSAFTAAAVERDGSLGRWQTRSRPPRPVWPPSTGNRAGGVELDTAGRSTATGYKSNARSPAASGYVNIATNASSPSPTPAWPTARCIISS